VVCAAIFAALEKAGIEFHHDGKRFGVSINVRKVAEGLTKMTRRSACAAVT
jgi:hypothetical protein